MTVQIQRATKTQAKLRLAIPGPAGAGKTYTALLVAQGILEAMKAEKLPLLIDTEAGSSSKYADIFEFDTILLETFHPERYLEAIHTAEKAGYPVIVIDSLTHAWSGKEGVMEQVDLRKSSQRNQFTAWNEPSKMHQQLIEAILQSPAHIIATMRSKMEYVQEGGEIKKLGMAPVQREGTEYEFDVVLDIDIKHNGRIGKTRFAAIADQSIAKPGKEFGKKLHEWLSSGAPAPVPAPKPAAPPPAAPAPAPAAQQQPAPGTPMAEREQNLIRQGYRAAAGLLDDIPGDPAMLAEFAGFMNTRVPGGWKWEQLWDLGGDPATVAEAFRILGLTRTEMEQAALDIFALGDPGAPPEAPPPPTEPVEAPGEAPATDAPKRARKAGKAAPA